jgi:hypothetical protein
VRRLQRWQVALLGLLLAAILAGAAFAGRQERGAVYSVQEVQMGTAQQTPIPAERRSHSA